MHEPCCKRAEREAAEKVEVALKLCDPESDHDHGDDVFDPWELFPAVYGSYDAAFDQMAIHVLEDVRDKTYHREDLAARILGGRPMLCVDQSYFTDAVSGKQVGLYRDTLGRMWMAESGPWSIFRVAAKELS